MSLPKWIWAYKNAKTESEKNSAFERIKNAFEKKIRGISSTMRGKVDEDLVGVGYEGLYKALNRYDDSISKNFESFALKYIRGSMLHYLRDYHYTIRLPAKVYEKRRKELQESFLNDKIISVHYSFVDLDDVEVPVYMEKFPIDVLVSRLSGSNKEVRSVLNLKLMGYTEEEIGRIMCIKASRVNMIIRNCREKYKQIYQNCN